MTRHRQRSRRLQAERTAFPDHLRELAHKARMLRSRRRAARQMHEEWRASRDIRADVAVVADMRRLSAGVPIDHDADIDDVVLSEGTRVEDAKAANGLRLLTELETLADEYDLENLDAAVPPDAPMIDSHGAPEDDVT